MSDIKNKKKVLITGGTGFIGSNLVKYLSEAGYMITIVHRQGTDISHFSHIVFESIICDFLQDSNKIREILYNPIQNSDVVFHLAASKSHSKKYDQKRKMVNVQASMILAQLVREIGKCRLVYVSSTTGIGYPQENELINENKIFNFSEDPYALSKYQGEQGILEEVDKGLDAVIAIPGNVFGSYQIINHQYNLLKKIKKGKIIVYPSGGLCFTYINDLIQGLMLCWKKGVSGQRYILGGSNITYKEYFKEIAKVTGGYAPWIRLPKIIMLFLGSCLDSTTYFNMKSFFVTKTVAKIISVNMYYSSEKSRKKLGYEVTDWHEVIRKTIRELGLNKDNDA